VSMSKPKFDPNKPYEEIKPKFDPNKPYNAAEVTNEDPHVASGILDNTANVLNKTLNVMPNTVQVGLLNALGKLKEGEAKDLMNPLSAAKMGSITERLTGAGEGPEIPFTRNMRLAAAGIGALTGTDPGKYIPAIHARDLADVAIDTGTSFGTSLITKPVAMAAKAIPYAGKYASGLLGLLGGTNEFSQFNRARQAQKAENIYKEAFQYAQKKADVDLGRDLTPFYKQAMDEGFSGSFEDFINFLDKKFSTAGKGLKSLTQKAGNPQVEIAPLLKRYDEEAGKIANSYRTDIPKETSTINKFKKSVMDKLSKDYGIDSSVFTQRKDPVTGDVILGRPEAISTELPRSIPIEEMQNIKQQQVGQIYDEVAGVGLDKGAGHRGTEAAVMGTKNDIRDAYNLVDPSLGVEYDVLNKAAESSSPTVQKMLSSYAKRTSEMPTGISQVELMNYPLALGHAALNPTTGIPHLAAAEMKRSARLMKALENSTGKASELLKKSKQPVSTNLEAAGSRAAWMNLLKQISNQGDQDETK
jgi:hypothetical protein